MISKDHRVLISKQQSKDLNLSTQVTLNLCASSTYFRPELGTTSHDIVVVGNKYPWAKSTSGTLAVLRGRSLHSLCFAKRQAAKSWVYPNRFHGFSYGFSFCFLLSAKREVSSITPDQLGHR